jgi:DNA-binding NarL/FixJ family response regulator
MAASIRRRAAGAVIRRLPGRDRDRSRDDARARIAGVTAREREVLALLGEGASNGDIGGRIHVSEAAVKTHVSRVLIKLGLAKRVQAAILAHRAGLLDDPT